jgi:hypothetical protein
MNARPALPTAWDRSWHTPWTRGPAQTRRSPVRPGCRSPGPSRPPEPAHRAGTNRPAPSAGGRVRPRPGLARERFCPCRIVFVNRAPGSYRRDQGRAARAGFPASRHLDGGNSDRGRCPGIRSVSALARLGAVRATARLINPRSPSGAARLPCAQVSRLPPPRLDRIGRGRAAVPCLENATCGGPAPRPLAAPSTRDWPAD